MPVCTIQQPTPTHKYLVSELSEAAQAVLYSLLYEAYRGDYGMSHMECLTALIAAQHEKLDNLYDLLTLEQRQLLRNMGEI